jgi:iron complex transport system substrate-binding protein
MDLSTSVPMRTRTRTLVTAFLALAMTSTLAACSGSDGATADDSAERTVEHAMGTTDVPGDPQRVVVLDTVLLDATMALDVTPVGTAMIANSESLPDYLGDEVSEISSVGPILEPDLEQIAELEPDLILSAKTRHEDLYDSLIDIAPTVFTETSGEGWRDSVSTVGEALNRATEAETLLEDYDSKVAEVREAIGVEGESAQVVRPREAGAFRLYGPDTFTGDVLTDLGFSIPEQDWDDSGIIELSAENADQAAADWLFLSDDTSNPELSEETIDLMKGDGGGVPLYLFIGPERGLVAGPGMAWFPCHSWSGGCCRQESRTRVDC